MKRNWVNVRITSQNNRSYCVYGEDEVVNRDEWVGKAGISRFFLLMSGGSCQIVIDKRPGVVDEMNSYEIKVRWKDNVTPLLLDIIIEGKVQR